MPLRWDATNTKAMKNKLYPYQVKQIQDALFGTAVIIAFIIGTAAGMLLEFPTPSHIIPNGDSLYNKEEIK